MTEKLLQGGITSEIYWYVRSIRLGFEEALKEKGLTSKTVFVSEIKNQL